MESENVNQAVNTSPVIATAPKSKMKKIYLLSAVVLLLLIVCTGAYYVVSPTESTQTNTEVLPKLAYIGTTGTASFEDRNPDAEGVFVVSPANSDKKLLYKFNRAAMINAYGFPLYSPLTHEILKYISEGVIAIDINTGKVRNVYKQKSNSTCSFILSGDYKSIYITERATDAERLVTGKTDKYIVSLSGNNTPEQVESFPVDTQPYFDIRTGKSIEVNVKDSTVGGAGTFITSSKFIVTDTKSNTKKAFIYNKPGEIEPLFTANNYFYFKVNQCCASTDRLGSMTQLNLETGEFSIPSTLPELEQRLTNKNFILENRGISPDGTYYVYNVVSTLDQDNEDINTYLFNTNTKQETKLNVGSDRFIQWSSDSKYVLFDYDEPEGYMYSINSQKLQQTKIPPSTNYIILR